MDDIDPSQRLQLNVLEEEYRRAHGVAIEWLKSAVGEGETFQNEVARVTMSPNGAWFECIDLPMEFSGAAGAECEHEFISDEQFRALAARLVEVGTSGNEALHGFSLLILYAKSGIVDERFAYVHNRRQGPDGEARRPLIIGSPQPDAVPRLLRCRLDSPDAIAGVPIARGVIVCLGSIGERNLLVLLPHSGEDVRDLGAMSPGPTPT